MSASKMGETLTDREIIGTRDAFHVPGILVVSDELVYPGESVRFIDEALTQVKPCALRGRHAIADPFVKGEIKVGQVFLALPVPGTTDNLVHRFDVHVNVAPFTFDRTSRVEGEPGYATDEQSAYAMECRDCH